MTGKQTNRELSRIGLTSTLLVSSLCLTSIAVAEEQQEEPLPESSARRYELVEPVGQWPSPWAALSATIDGGATLDGELGWTGIRAHVPVYNRYGAVDFRLEAQFNGDEFIALHPELVLRAMPFRFDEGRGVLGFAASMLPGIKGDEPTMWIGGGLLGGYVGHRWFLWGYLGARGDVIQGRGVEISGHLSAGLRLPHGFRPQVEIDIIGEARRHGYRDVSIVVRPALRFWPTDWIGIGVSGDIWALTPEETTAGLRLDVVLLAME